MAIVNIDNLIGRRNGIIKEIYTIDIDSSEPDIFSFVAERGQLEWETQEEDATRYGSGGGLLKTDALLSACGEVIERYCSSFIPQDTIVGSFNQLKHDHFLIDPAQIEFFSEKQYATVDFPFKKFSRDSVVEWVNAYSYGARKEIYIPAFLTYLPYHKSELGGLHAPASSTGLACAPTVEEATEKAILELIERDAFTVFWLNRLSPPSITIDELPHIDIAIWKKKFRFDAIKYYIFDITSNFNIPIIAVFCFGNSSFGYVAAMGLGTSLNTTHAIKKALIENALGRRAIYFYKKKYPDKKYRSDFRDLLSFHDHGYVYSTDPSLKSKLSFLLETPYIETPYTDLKNSIGNNNSLGQSLVGYILECGFDVIIKDLTTPDIKSVGLRVVRVLIPGLTQLHGIHAFPFLGCQRLYNPAEVFSWSRKNKSTEAELNDFPPHMMP